LLSPPPPPQQQRTLSPKDKIMLDVLRRYPPLRTSMLGLNMEEDDDTEDSSMQKLLASASSSSSNHHISSWNNYIGPFGIGEADIRQTYHPMLANVTQSDMDIIFVGTASCTPGITRGVSCTAVRLNWRRRRNDNNNNNIIEDNDNNSRGRNTGGGGIGTWLFDCGESTQLSIQRTPSIKPGRITKIFITHCHGDHSFGLPGLLCLMGTDRPKEYTTTTPPVVDIYGPEGLRMWLRVAIRYSVSRVVPHYRVHELMDIPMAPEWVEGHRKNGRYYMQPQQNSNVMNNYNSIGGGGSSSEENSGTKKGSNTKRWAMQGLAGDDTTSWISRAPMINLEPSKDFGEVEGGRDIYPIYDHPESFDGAPVWNVINNDVDNDSYEGYNDEDDDVVVHAAPMSHGVPCVGYVIRERDQPGKLRPELVLPVIERNHAALVQSGIVKNPMKVMSIIKNLKPGTNYTFPDGTVLHQEDVVEPTKTGRKVVICGDTADSRALEKLAHNANVVIHEATNTYLPGIDKDGSMKSVTRDTMIHGHSTPSMAGEFAKRINAKKLVLNHFSARYKGDQSLDSITIMTRIERQARKASGLSEDSVAAAWDFMILPVSR
jgi:ribonuclease BN (tRNA processing enzyme)